MKHSEESLAYYYHKFSKSAKILLAKTRLIAVELGFDYICETHFLIADCQLNKADSIKEFAFGDDEGLDRFISKNRKDNQNIFPEYEKKALPLTKNTELMIRNALMEAEKLGSKEIEPFHFFLGSCYVNNFMFTTTTQSKEILYQRMMDYYQRKGMLPLTKNKKGFKHVLMALFKKNN